MALINKITHEIVPVRAGVDQLFAQVGVEDLLANIGQEIFDTDLGKKVIYTGSNWYDLMGNLVD